MANALIRAHFNIDPKKLDDYEWAELFTEATFLERLRNDTQEKILTKVFVKVFGKKK